MAKKRGQMQMSFGMIFSIILIIAFLGFAFYAIKTFLNMSCEANVGSFANDLQEDIDMLWKGSYGSQQVTYNLPSKIEYVCFMDGEGSGRGTWRNFYNELQFNYFNDENLFFWPVGSSCGIDSVRIDHIDLGEIVLDNNPRCFKVSKGKVSFRIRKDFGESLVRIE